MSVACGVYDERMTSKQRKRLRSLKYDRASHRLIRKALVPVVASGNATCARCVEPIEPGTPWDLGHADDGLGYNGLEHAACNRGAWTRCVTSREW